MAKTPDELDRERGFLIPQSLSHHEYTTRMMRVLGVVHVMEVREGYPRDEFLIRSCMISNILVADYHEKLEIEAGTLSYLPQYCPYNLNKERKAVHRTITNNFGKNRSELVKEVEELRQAYVNDLEVEGFSRHAKSIYAIHVYLDLVNMLNPYSSVKVIDGVLYTIDHKKDQEIVDVDGDVMEMDRFYAYMIATAEWKLETLLFSHTNIQQAISELCKHLRRTKGIDIHYKEMK